MQTPKTKKNIRSNLYMKRKRLREKGVIFDDDYKKKGYNSAVEMLINDTRVNYPGKNVSKTQQKPNPINEYTELELKNEGENKVDENSRLDFKISPLIEENQRVGGDLTSMRSEKNRSKLSENNFSPKKFESPNGFSGNHDSNNEKNSLEDRTEDTLSNLESFSDSPSDLDSGERDYRKLKKHVSEAQMISNRLLERLEKEKGEKEFNSKYLEFINTNKAAKELIKTIPVVNKHSREIGQSLIVTITFAFISTFY